jgi:hypothetical protein
VNTDIENLAMPPNLEIPSLAVKGNQTFAAIRMNGVYLSTNNGTNWAAWNSGLSILDPTESLLVIGDTIFAGTLGFGVWKSSISAMNGIEEINGFNDFAIYPNPASDNLTIESPQPAIIEISNIEGQLIKTLTASTTKTNIDHVGWSSYVVDVSSLPCGVYIVEVRNEKGVGVRKFVKE